MSNEIIYGKNLLSKKLISNKKFRGICYHKNKKFIYKPLETTKPISKNEKYDFIITTKKPHDRAAYELLKLSFINSKFYDYKKKIFTDNKKDIDILNYSKKLSKFKKYIDKYHVISFDLFETLLDKNFSSNSDIYEVVNLKIKNKKYIKYRYEIEKKLVHKKNFIINYDEILDNLQKKIDCNNRYKKKIKKLEEEIELSNLFVRKEISELLFYAKKKRKKLFLPQTPGLI